MHSGITDLVPVEGELFKLGERTIPQRACEESHAVITRRIGSQLESLKKGQSPTFKSVREHLDVLCCHLDVHTFEYPQPTKDLPAGEAEWRQAQSLHVGKALSCERMTAPV